MTSLTNERNCSARWYTSRRWKVSTAPHRPSPKSVAPIDVVIPVFVDFDGNWPRGPGRPTLTSCRGRPGCDVDSISRDHGPVAIREACSKKLHVLLLPLGREDQLAVRRARVAV